MSTVIVGQTYTINSTLSIDISGSTSVIIKYQKPNDTSVYDLQSSISIKTNSISSVVSNTINDTVGRWKCWLHILYPSGIIYKSKPTIIEVIEEGQI